MEGKNEFFEGERYAGQCTRRVVDVSGVWLERIEKEDYLGTWRMVRVDKVLAGGTSGERQVVYKRIVVVGGVWLGRIGKEGYLSTRRIV